jgi:hypothetical protein
MTESKARVAHGRNRQPSAILLGLLHEIYNAEGLNCRYIPVALRTARYRANKRPKGVLTLFSATVAFPLESGASVHTLGGTK